jgi:hypothetical protein
LPDGVRGPIRPKRLQRLQPVALAPDLAPEMTPPQPGHTLESTVSVGEIRRDAVSSITVPVFEDRSEERVCRFREIGETEEPIASSGPAD